MASPKVFISYSHDSPAHEAKVLALADRLRSNGVDAVLDQYESFPTRGWIQWMKDQVRDADFVLVVCTETYERRWDGEEAIGVGLGATFEGQTLQQILYDAAGTNERLIPVWVDEDDGRHIPLELRKYSHFRPYSDDGYLELYRLLTNQPKVKKPKLGVPLELKKAKADFRNSIWNVPPRNVFFTGRTQTLQAIRKALTEKSTAAISGLGGMGKTQTAIEYAYANRHQYSVALWCVADSRDALVSGFAAFARLLDLPEKTEKDLSVVAAAVRGWLESNSGWLLILDNVEDLMVVREFAPNVSGHVLITTRPHATGAFAEPVELRKMTPDEGADFLLRRAKKKDGHASAREISIEVDGLPLALDQAGAFIEETPSTFEEYLELYRKKGGALRAQRGDLATDHPDSVTITFSLAFAKLAEANPAAADLVRGCGFLAPDAIPEEIFTQAGDEWGEPIAWLKMMKDAGRFGLMRRDAESKSLYIHRLVQEVVKDEMSVETRWAWAERLVQALSKVFPEIEFRNWPQCERLLPHARTVARLLEDIGLESAEAALLLNESGSYLCRRAQFAEAEPLFQRALTIHEGVLGTEHSYTVASQSNLAVLYLDQHRNIEAEPLLRRSLEIAEKTLGPEHLETARGVNNLAGFYHNQGRYAEAEPLFQRALAIMEKAHGSEHPNTAIGLNNLAKLYGDQGRCADAEPLYRRAIAIREKTLGPEDPNTANSLHNLAALYEKQGRYAEAEDLCRGALAIVEKAFGPDHPYTINVIRNHVVILRKLGRHDEADKLLARLS